MELPTKGDATGFYSEKIRDLYGLFLIAQIRYAAVMDSSYSWDEHERINLTCEECAAAIRKEGAHEAIFERT